jgi:hypothetical protein
MFHRNSKTHFFFSPQLVHATLCVMLVLLPQEVRTSCSRLPTLFAPPVHATASLQPLLSGSLIFYSFFFLIFVTKLDKKIPLLINFIAAVVIQFHWWRL